MKNMKAEGLDTAINLLNKAKVAADQRIEDLVVMLCYVRSAKSHGNFDRKLDFPISLSSVVSHH